MISQAQWPIGHLLRVLASYIVVELQFKGGLSVVYIGCRAGYRITCDGGEEEGKVETASGSPDDDGTSGAIRSDSAYSYNITDGNPTQAGGQIAMDASGALSLQYDGGKL